MKLLRDLRLERRETQEDLAEALGVDVSNVQRWEYGQTTPREKNKQRVAKHYGLTVGDINWQPYWEKGERARKWQQRIAENTTT